MAILFVDGIPMFKVDGEGDPTVPLLSCVCCTCGCETYTPPSFLAAPQQYIDCEVDTIDEDENYVPALCDGIEVPVVNVEAINLEEACNPNEPAHNGTCPIPCTDFTCYSPALSDHNTTQVRQIEILDQHCTWREGYFHHVPILPNEFGCSVFIENPPGGLDHVIICAETGGFVDCGDPDWNPLRCCHPEEPYPAFCRRRRFLITTDECGGMACIEVSPLEETPACCSCAPIIDIDNIVYEDTVDPDLKFVTFDLTIVDNVGCTVPFSSASAEIYFPGTGGVGFDVRSVGNITTPMGAYPINITVGWAVRVSVEYGPDCDYCAVFKFFSYGGILECP